MPRLNFRRFANPGALKEIEAVHLCDLLRPHAAYLTLRGVSIPDAERPVLVVRDPGGEAPDPALDYDAIAKVLLEPDESTPQKLIDALFVINEMATPEVMAELVALKDVAELLRDSLDPSPADVATRVYLHDHVLLEDMHANQVVSERSSFECFRSRDVPTTKFESPAIERIEALQGELGQWFREKKKGDQVRVFVFAKADDVWFLVRHGEGIRREGAQRDGLSTSVCYRPERHDVLVYTPASGELRINAGSRGETDVYRRLFGHYVFTGIEHFPSTNKKYSLAPLWELGPDALACTDVAGIERIVLAEIVYSWGGSQGEFEVRRAKDLFIALGERGSKVLDRTVSAKFRVKFADSRTPRSVTIRPPKVAKFTRDDDGRLVDQWLTKRGFSVLPPKATDAKQ